MGRIKNMKIAKLFSLGLISCLLLNSNVAKADTISFTNGTVLENVTLNNVNDINSVDNVGISLAVKGTITTIEGSYITIKDESGEAKVYLDGITVEGLKVDDYIFVTGIVNLQESINVVVVVNNVSNIGVVNNDVTETPDDSEENSGSEDTETPEDSGTTDDTENPGNTDGTENPGQGGNNNSNTNQQENNSGTNNNVGNISGGLGNTNVGGSGTTNTITNTTTVATKATIKGKTATTISYDLSSSQWSSIQSAYEDGDIKLQDLPNNKIRIIKVAEDKGDTVWIVNDPRLLDEEDDSVFTVGTKLIGQIDYTLYDVAESKWKDIVEDVESGEAKIKFLDDESIKVIYNKTDGTDSTTTISKN